MGDMDNHSVYPHGSRVANDLAPESIGDEIQVNINLLLRLWYVLGWA